MRKAVNDVRTKKIKHYSAPRTLFGLFKDTNEINEIKKVCLERKPLW